MINRLFGWPKNNEICFTNIQSKSIQIKPQAKYFQFFIDSFLQFSEVIRFIIDIGIIRKKKKDNLLEILGKSLVYKRNNSGPKLIPA